MATAAQLVAEVKTTGVSEAKGQLKEMSDTVDQTSGGFKGMLGNALSFAAGGLVMNAVGAAAGFLKDQIGSVWQETMLAQQSMAQTNAVLKSTHDASGETAQAVADLADKYSHLTLFSDDTVQSAENMLLTTHPHYKEGEKWTSQGRISDASAHTAYRHAKMSVECSCTVEGVNRNTSIPGKNYKNRHQRSGTMLLWCLWVYLLSRRCLSRMCAHCIGQERRQCARSDTIQRPYTVLSAWASGAPTHDSFDRGKSHLCRRHGQEPSCECRVEHRAGQPYRSAYGLSG